MTLRRVVAVPLLAGSLALAGCASSTDGSAVAHPGAGGSSSNGAASNGASGPGTTTGSGATSAPGAADATPTTASALAQRLREAAQRIKTAHFTLEGSAGGQSFSGSGDQTLSNGKAVAYSLTETIPHAGQLSLIMTGGKTYIRLPATLGGSKSKPWQVASTTSSNPVVRQFAKTLDSVTSASSLGQITLFTQAVSALKVVGASTVDGAHATQYSLTVALAKLPLSFPGRALLLQAGLTSLPIELWIDDQGRPVKLTENFTVSHATVSTAVSLGRFDQPVTITAPPASQVAPN